MATNLLPFVLAITALSACDSATGVEEDLQAARTRWESTSPAAYEFTLQRQCFCAPGVTRPVVVSVRGGTVERRTYADTGAPVDAQLADAFPEINGLFAVIDSAIARGADKITADFDPTRGFPVHIAIDYYANAADDELSLVVSDFKTR